MPPHLIRNWQRSFSALPDGRLRVHVIRGLTPYVPEADVYIIHYPLCVQRLEGASARNSFRTVIFDEMQELRHNGTGSIRCQFVAQARENVIGLSGTPIYNQGGEIWNVINILDFHCLGDWESFSREWCYGYNSAVVAKPELLANICAARLDAMPRQARCIEGTGPPSAASCRRSTGTTSTAN